MARRALSGVGRALLQAIRQRLLDESVEQRAVLSRLGVPQYADREALLGILQRFDRAVIGPRDLAQPFADATEALVMVRLDRRAIAKQPTDLRLG